MFHNPNEQDRLFVNFDRLVRKRFGNADTETLYGILDGTTEEYRDFVESLGEDYEEILKAWRATKKYTSPKFFKELYDRDVKELNVPSAYDQYHALAGEVESRNVQKRMGMTEAERRASLASETEDVSREDQIFLFGEGGESHMGSRTDKRMAEIDEHYEGRGMSDEQRAIVDVFSGKRDRQTVTFTGKDGKEHQMVMIQGQDSKAGSKHAIYRHYGNKPGWFDADDLPHINDVVQHGEEKREMRGKTRLNVYRLDIDGVKYTVLTEVKKGKEIFNDFYTNRKASSFGTSNTSEEAHTSNDNAFDAAKVAEDFRNRKVSAENVADEGMKFRLLENDDPKVQETNNEAMADRVNELTERLHTPVRIVRTDEEVASLPSARQRRMKGSFNPMTGEVTIVVPNNANLADVENTFIHEVVGHDGLRVLFPEEEKLAGALDELYRVSNEGIRQTIDRMAQKMYDAEVDRLREKKRREHEAKGEDANAHYYTDMAEAHVEASKKREQLKRDATEEYAADLAGRIGEKGFEKMSAEEQTFWGKLKTMLQKALAQLQDGLKIPGKRKWGDKDWAFVLHEAYKRKKNGGRPTVFDAADTEVMRRKTGYGETKFSDGYKKSAKHGEARLNAFQLPSDAGHNEKGVQQSEAALKHLEPTDTEHTAKVLKTERKPKKPLQMWRKHSEMLLKVKVSYLL